MSNKHIKISGKLSIHSCGEADGILYVDSIKEPLAEYLEDMIEGKNVTVSYTVSDKECTFEKARVEILKQLDGAADCEWGHRYSDYTGYLWTDEVCHIGGHNLIEELKNNVGKYLNLEIVIHGRNDEQQT